MSITRDGGAFGPESVGTDALLMRGSFGLGPCVGYLRTSESEQAPAVVSIALRYRLRDTKESRNPLVRDVNIESLQCIPKICRHKINFWNNEYPPTLG
jgi:hypothetical protein